VDIDSKFVHLGRSINNRTVIKTKVNIVNDTGLHARPATILAKEASAFDADFIIQKRQKRVNGKSILEILTLIAEQGDELTLEWNGTDENAAAKSITRLFKNGFELEK
jgi:phosphocarrier protein